MEKLIVNSKLKWDKRFLEIAKLVSTWSTCVRNGRKVGSVIVLNKHIIATGFNGAPAGVESCLEKGYCLRDKMGIPSGTRAEYCYATHAEQNAIVQAAKLGVSVNGATIYVTHRPCAICSKFIINSGIKRIVFAENYPDDFAMELLNQTDIEIDQIPFEEK